MPLRSLAHPMGAVQPGLLIDRRRCLDDVASPCADEGAARQRGFLVSRCATVHVQGGGGFHRCPPSGRRAFLSRSRMGADRRCHGRIGLSPGLPALLQYVFRAASAMGRSPPPPGPAFSSCSSAIPALICIPAPRECRAGRAHETNRGTGRPARCLLLSGLSPLAVAPHAGGGRGRKQAYCDSRHLGTEACVACPPLAQPPTVDRGRWQHKGLGGAKRTHDPSSIFPRPGPPAQAGRLCGPRAPLHSVGRGRTSQ